MSLLSVENLSVHFEVPEGTARAVDGVSFEIAKGETVGLVGESGCGKTVTGLSLLRLVPTPPGRYVSGRIMFEGRDILTMKAEEIRQVRGGRISMIFQDPAVSLNPVFTIGTQLVEALMLHRGMMSAVAWRAAGELLAEAGLPDPEQRLHEYPHQLSGGMKQRVVIAMALTGEPELIIADEPTTALDVTVQAQILTGLDDLQKRRGMAVLLVTHDLGLVAERTRRVYVMYAGKIVEAGPTAEVLKAPKHPYTRALLAALPSRQSRGKALVQVKGNVPAATAWPSGCRFHPRCPEVVDRCRTEVPALAAAGDARCAACVLLEKQS